VSVEGDFILLIQSGGRNEALVAESFMVASPVRVRPWLQKIKTMWIRTINGIEFIEVKFTSQGFPIPKTK
jgi:hypothetical protein